MAAVTGDARVTALERVSRAAVVEARPLDPLPPRGRVTARAGRSQPGSVHVLVAAHALSARDPLEPHVEHRGARGVRGALAVALPARHGGVLAGQRPGGLRVVEAGSGLPGDLAVAGGAVPSRELSPVLVGVAGRARGREAEVGPGVIDPLGGEGLPLVEESRLVAVPAGELCVPALKRVTRLAVVEGLSSGLAPPDQLVLLALVLDVAGLAVAVFRPGMQPLSGGGAGGGRPGGGWPRAGRRGGGGPRHECGAEGRTVRGRDVPLPRGGEG